MAKPFDEIKDLTGFWVQIPAIPTTLSLAGL